VLYNLAYLLVRLILGFFFRVDVVGEENVPDGACLVVSNHLSWTDTIFIAYALPRLPKLHTMANRATVFDRPWKRWLMPKFALFPVTRQRGYLDEEAVETVYQLLQSGERVLIFPEGAYGKDGRLRPLKEGVGHFAINSGKQLLPVSVRGTARLRPFSRVTIVIGPPFIPAVPAWWDLKRGVGAVVATVATALSRLSSSRPRRPLLRRVWDLRLRRTPAAQPVVVPVAEAPLGRPAEVGGVVVSDSEVDGQQSGSQQSQP